MCGAHEDKHHARHLERVAWGSVVVLAFVAGAMLASWGIEERPEAYCYQDEQPSAPTGQD